MHRYGHYGAALLAYAPVGLLVLALGFETAAVGGAMATVGLSMLPDIDLKLPFIKHRGPTHTVTFALLVGAIVGLVFAAMGAAHPDIGTLLAVALGPFGFVVGALAVGSHIAADALTPMGVEPFGDGRHYSYGLCTADNEKWNYALLGFGGLAVAIAYGLGTGIAAVLGLG